MFFYEVIPADRSYHGQGFLTYSHDSKLALGQIVVVTLRAKSIVGFVIKEVAKPNFATKPIQSIIADLIVPEVSVAMFSWLHSYYPGPLGPYGSLFVPPSLTTKKLPDISSINPPTPIDDFKLPNLTKSQKEVIDKILSNKPQTHLIHGDTGSGKTRIYIELAKKTLAEKRSVLILVPEISLTPQMLTSFIDIFTNIHIVHSGITPSVRRETWRAIAAAKSPQIVIGARSALFMPLKNIGLIVVDEFHEAAYKQDQIPRYHATRVASKLASTQNAKLILGSATPPVEDYFYAVTKGSHIHRITEKPVNVSYGTTNHVVNLSDQSELSGYQLLSKTLIDGIRQSLEQKEQSLLFINKRGSSRLLLCQSCGWHASCERCNIPYVYHQDSHTLVCHTCGHQEKTPNNCPACKSEKIIFKNPGTKSIVDSLAKIFPKARIARFDKDNKKDDAFSAQYQKILSGEVDILVGTQLLTKGHDLPNLGLVGILLAESELQFPDFSSEERSYQLLHQLAGRVGRGHRPGKVILQTYNPGSPTIVAIEHKKNAWIEFYDLQLRNRRLFGFPPYVHLLKIEVGRANDKDALKACKKIYDDIDEKYKEVTIVGPAPAFIAKQNNRWYWQLAVKSKKRSILVDIARSLPGTCSYDIDPINLL